MNAWKARENESWEVEGEGGKRRGRELGIKERNNAIIGGMGGHGKKMAGRGRERKTRKCMAKPSV